MLKIHILKIFEINTNPSLLNEKITNNKINILLNDSNLDDEADKDNLRKQIVNTFKDDLKDSLEEAFNRSNIPKEQTNRFSVVFYN